MFSNSQCTDIEAYILTIFYMFCNSQGTDIEAYILTGRQAGSGQMVSSDTSVDSGVFVDKPVHGATRDDLTGQSVTK